MRTSTCYLRPICVTNSASFETINLFIKLAGRFAVSENSLRTQYFAAPHYFHACPRQGNGSGNVF